MDSEATKTLQFLIDHLCQQVQFSALRNRAYEKLAPQLAEEASSLLTTPEFVELIQKTSEIRLRAVEAVAYEDWRVIVLGIGEMTKILTPH